MTGALTIASVSVLAALMVAVVLPALGMRMLMPALQASTRKVRNFRGVEVSAGLGIVWLLWGVLVLAASLKASVLVPTAAAWAWGLESWSGWSVPVTLVILAFAFGMIDDVFGSADAKGFRGHLMALAEGRLTSGGLKLVGIGISAAVAAGAGRLASSPARALLDPVSIGTWVLATFTIALAANFVNLTDLRPGRALKTYCLLVVAALPAVALTAATRQGASGGAGVWSWVAVTAVLALGPVLAVWRYDLGEVGMLGDSGANAMGALAGFLLASSLPLWALALSTVALLTLNLLSERVSFSAVIEQNALLRWFDGLGRLKDVPADAEDPGREREDGGAAAPSGLHDRTD